MTLDVYNYFLKHPKYNKLIGDDYLFVEYKCPIDSENFKLWTDTNFISYVISGKKDWTSIHKKVTVTEGEALFIKKGVYNTKQYFEVDYCVILFFITDDFIRKFYTEHEDHFYSAIEAKYEPSQLFNIDVNESLNSLFFTVFNYLNQGTPIPKDLVEIKFKELLFNIILNPNNKELVHFFTSLKQIEKSNLEEVMNKNFHCDLKLEEFARLSGRSLSTFKRDFIAHFNETPGKWINNKRLSYARTLLQNHEFNINDVCFESGFKNASHFNKSFKEKYKHPPNQYRKLFF